MKHCENLFAALPADVTSEVFERIGGSGNVRIERIVSAGHVTPDGVWYDQSEAEFVLLLSGAARLRFFERDELVEMQPGDYLTIEPHCKHRVEWTATDAATVWLAVQYSATRKRET
jgi:cupin 2 domain-containing protein